jgi:hypothetical protein
MTDITDLPFIASTGKHKLSYWNTRPNGDYADECLLGEAYAREVVQYMAEDNDPTLLGLIVSEMNKQMNHSGIEVGFMHAIAKFAIATAAKNTSMQPTK